MTNWRICIPLLTPPLCYLRHVGFKFHSSPPTHTHQKKGRHIVFFFLLGQSSVVSRRNWESSFFKKLEDVKMLFSLFLLTMISVNQQDQNKSNLFLATWATHHFTSNVEMMSYMNQHGDLFTHYLTLNFVHFWKRMFMECHFVLS